MNKGSLVQFFLLFITAAGALGQANRETKEIKGVVAGIHSGQSFAYSVITVEEAGGMTTDLHFAPEHGRTIVDNFKVGDSILLKANVASKPIDPATRKLMKETMHYFLMGTLIAIRIQGTWTDMAWALTKSWEPPRDGFVFLNRQVMDVYKEGPHPRAITFDNGRIGFYPGLFAKPFNPLIGVEPGDLVSFIGRQYRATDGYVYPIKGVREVFVFQRLYRTTGTIHSLLFKQNYVCIGISMATNRGEVKASFPTEYGREVQKFADGRKIDIYVSDFKIEGQLHPPELHAIVSGPDTLLIKQVGFYGGADGGHEHVPVALQGKVTAVDKVATGNITGVILDEETFVEIDGNTARQLANVLRRGKTLEINGGERVKKDGEIYSKDYRIVVPYQITVDGKVFLINTRP